MRVKSKKIQVRTYAELNVTSYINGAIVLHGRMDNGDCWDKPISPQEAVQVWRRMMGETEEALHIPSPHLDLKYDEHDETWMFSDKEVLCVMDADECMLVAWAIEKAAGISLYTNPVHPAWKDSENGDVWILVSSSRPGPGSNDKEYCRSLGGNAKVFSSREAALDGLREFLREEVNKVHDENLWKELEEHGRNVDDIIDEIIEVEEGNPAGVWMYDGTARSFVVQLMKEKVVK